MRMTLSVLVENHSGVLARITGLFARRGYNIESLSVSETDDKTISRMTIVAEGDERILEQVSKQLNKQIDVIKVKILASDDSTRRELALIKVSADPKTRGEIYDIVNIMNAKVVDISPLTLTVETADRPERVTLLLDMLKPYEVTEMVRTGMIAIHKGSGSIDS